MPCNQTIWDADESGSCTVWDTDTCKAVYYFPFHGRPLVSVAFNSSTEWLVCVSDTAIRCDWLAAPSVEDVLDIWLNDNKPIADRVALTRNLLCAYPHLPNTKVLPWSSSTAQQYPNSHESAFVDLRAPRQHDL
jgi:hypothetical protein